MAGIPVYRYRLAPDGLMTRRQLRAAGLRPGGNDPVAEIRWLRGRRFALLYDTTRAPSVRPMTTGRWRSHAAMMRARRTCPACRTDRGYVIPRSLGCCWPCANHTNPMPNQREETPPVECYAEFIDGSWTHCGCEECDQAEYEAIESDMETETSPRPKLSTSTARTVRCDDHRRSPVIPPGTAAASRQRTAAVPAHPYPRRNRRSPSMTHPSALLNAALAAADRGWHVFPLTPGTKRPAVRDWENRATLDPDRIRRCWAAGLFNIGIACGPSRLLVLDLDVPKHAGDFPPEP